MTIELMSYTWR